MVFKYLMTFLGKIKNKLLISVHSKLIRNQKTTKRIVDFESARSIGILFDYNNVQDREFVVGFADKLASSGKEVQILGYCKSKKASNFVEPESFFPKIVPQVCNDADFGFRKLFRTGALKRFVSYDFDLLVDLSPSDFHLIKVTVGLSSAKLKTGFYQDSFENRFDIMIRERAEAGSFTKLVHLEKYLKIINSPKND